MHIIIGNEVIPGSMVFVIILSQLYYIVSTSAQPPLFIHILFLPFQHVVAFLGGWFVGLITFVGSFDVKNLKN